MPVTKEKLQLAVEVGSRMKQLRESRGDTQEELAAATGLKRSQIAAYELGNVQPQLPALLAIARYYKVSWSVFEPNAPPIPAPSDDERLSLQLAKEASRLPFSLKEALVSFIEAVRKALDN